MTESRIGLQSKALLLSAAMVRASPGLVPDPGGDAGDAGARARCERSSSGSSGAEG